jgi:predicted nucleic acid-binding protein
MKPTVYIETSVISYLNSRPSRDLIIAAHQQITQDWWDNSLKHYDAFISSVVIDEISRGNKKAAELRLNSVDLFKILEVTDDVHKLADLYFKNMAGKENVRLDAYHLAFASLYNLDYVVTWNFKHIASGKIKSMIQNINYDRKLKIPILCTPEELTEE